MSGTIHRRFVLAASLGPPIGIAVAGVLLWDHFLHWHDLAIFAVMYVATGLGVTVGYHRLLTHRSFKAVKPVRVALATLGTMAAEGPVITWVAHHRKHHAHADEEGDPHSPHLEAQEGVKGALRGLWHAHLGWLLDKRLTSEPMRYAPDLAREPEMLWLSKYFLPVVLVGLAIPAAAGFLVTGTLVGAAAGLVWGGLVRLFLLHHATYSVNSICHYYGRRSYDVPDESRNVLWLALPSMGEAWHNNHHAFPSSARHGLRWWQIDPSAVFIGFLERLGLAHDVVRITPERERELQPRFTASKRAVHRRGRERQHQPGSEESLSAGGTRTG